MPIVLQATPFTEEEGYSHAANIGLFFMYRSLEYVMFMSCNDVLYVVYYYTVNVGCVKGSVVHGNRQQCLVAEWLGLSVTVRVRVRAKARECIFPLFFFFSVRSDKHLCLER